MKKKRSFLLVCIISFLWFVGVSLVSTATAQSTKPIELTLNDQMGPTHLFHQTHKYFAEQINKRTNGRVKITLFPVGTLTSPDKIYDGVVTGMSDMGNTSVAYTAGRFPSLDACFVPNPSKTGWVSSRMSNDFWFKFRPKENDDVHMLYLSSSGSFNLSMVKKPVYKPEDLKGLKIRASGPQLGAYARALGATPVNMPMSEVYEAAAKGVIDGFLTPWDTQKSWKHAEVTKYITVVPVSSSAPNMTFMNRRTWDSLPKDIQEEFTKLSAEAVEVHAKAWWYLDIDAQNYFRSLGGERKAIDIPPGEVSNWTRLLNPLVEKYVQDYSAKGLPAAEYVKYVMDRAKYWNEHHVSQKETEDWVKANLEPLLRK
jgi:TRAP-type transport system periplasmic protein